MEKHLQREQLERQKERDWLERKKQKPPAAQAKFFGDVLKYIMPKFPVYVADVPAFCEGVEILFSSFSVPTQLQTRLLLPNVNERVQSLLLRLERIKQENYDEVEQFIFHDLKLTQVQFKYRFDRSVGSSGETYTRCCS